MRTILFIGALSTILMSASAMATSVRLVFSKPNVQSQLDTKSNGVENYSTSSFNTCVATPNGEGEWCLPQAQQKMSTQSTNSKKRGPERPLVKIYNSYGYSAAEVASFLNQQTSAWVVEPDLVMTQLSTPTDPDFVWSVREAYFASKEQSPNGLNINTVWEKYDMAGAAQADKVNLVVMDSSFFLNDELVYVQGASFHVGEIVDGDFIYEDNSNDFLARFNEDGTYPEGCDGHGVGVAASAVGIANNDLASTGVTNNVNLYPVRTLDCGVGYGSANSDALYWISGVNFSGVDDFQAQGGGVVNLSLGSYVAFDETNPDRRVCPQYLQDAIDYATERGWVIVAAAGNNGLDADRMAPAACDKVISVAAINNRGSITSFSNTGKTVDFVAEGGMVFAPCSESSDACVWSGTSFSTPLVSGVIAGIKQISQADNAVIETALRLTASVDTLTDPACRGETCGEGLPNMDGALSLALSLSGEAGGNVIDYNLNIASATDNAKRTMVEYFGDRNQLCELISMRLIGGNEIQGAGYELYSRSITEQTWDNATLEGVFDSSQVEMNNIVHAGRQFGFKVCPAEGCLANIVDIESDGLSSLPVMCN